MHRIIKRYNPDIIHSNVSVINIGYYVAKLNNIPHIWHIREYGDIDFNIKPFPSKRIKGYRLRNKSYSISITKDLAHYYNLGSSNRTIYNGVVTSTIAPISYNKDKILIYVGWLTENKGVPMIIKSFINILKQHPDYKLYLIGEGDPEYVAHLKSIVDKNHIMDSILFLGYKKNVEYYMQRAKALIVASKMEGFGRITTEAMANGCLVIGINSGGTKEQFDNGVTMLNREIGIRFNNDKELENAIIEVIEMEDKRYNRIIVDGQHVVHSLYSKKANVDKTNNFVQEIINKNE